MNIFVKSSCVSFCSFLLIIKLVIEFNRSWIEFIWNSKLLYFGNIWSSMFRCFYSKTSTTLSILFIYCNDSSSLPDLSSSFIPWLFKLYRTKFFMLLSFFSILWFTFLFSPYIYSIFWASLPNLTSTFWRDSSSSCCSKWMEVYLWRWSESGRESFQWFRSF